MLKTAFSPQALSLFSYTPIQYMLRSMAAGNPPATAYVDQMEKPSVCLIHEGHSLFVGGDANCPAADEAMDFMNHTLLTLEIRRELHVMKIVFPDDAWKDRLTGTLFGESVNEYMRCVFRHPSPGGVVVSQTPHIQTITAKMAVLENFSMIRDEVNSTLGSFEKFLEKGFGYALVFENQVCGFCTAEYLSAGECAIGIEVLSGYQRHGYASEMTASFLQACARQGLTPYWECWKNNIPSVKTAQRAGFEKQAEYPVVFVVFGCADRA